MFRIVGIFGFIALVSACAQPAYVYNAGEFNRAASNFGKDPTDISIVTVCYSSRISTQEDVLELARAECGKFGKTAKFAELTYFTCPMVTPVSVEFRCLGGKDGDVAGKNMLGHGASAGHQVNYDGILFSY